jgi:hypothetical protein
MKGLAETVEALRELVERVQEPVWGTQTQELLEDIQRLQRVISAASAVQTVRIAQFAAREKAYDEHGALADADRGVGFVSEFAGDELAPVLGMAPSMSERRVRCAATLTARLPRTLRAVAEGDLDPFRAQVIAEELALADRDVCAAVEERIHPRAHGDSPGRLRGRVRRALASVDPLAVRAAAARARLGRCVQVRAGAVPGMSEWFAVLSTEDSAQCWAAVDELAHRMKADDPSRCLDACRADALVDLVMARAQVSATVTFAVPVHPRAAEAAPPATDPPEGCSTEAAPPPTDPPEGCSTEAAPPATDPPEGFGFGSVVGIPGIGVIAPGVVEALLGRLSTKVARTLVDARTGVTLETTTPRYRPTEGMRRFVQMRDGTCRFPGCGVQARRCQLDHVLPAPAGPTRPSNLIALCQHHHRLKTFGGWRPVLARDGTVEWADPYGQAWVTSPVDHLATRVA